MWIKFSERMPQDKQGVLVTDGKDIVCAEFLKKDFEKYGHWTAWDGHLIDGYDWDWDFDFKKATHWMPLPEVPHEK